MTIKEFLIELNTYGILDHRIDITENKISEDIEICLRSININLDDEI